MKGKVEVLIDCCVASQVRSWENYSDNAGNVSIILTEPLALDRSALFFSSSSSCAFDGHNNIYKT